ncbi:hypothetical protein ACIQYW_14070 [Rhodococcus erythropolis]|uniref:hypothetical protein n=1 Tax=Rhodococcus baikonurensis TaxID=172041 RepID=UPI0033997E39
MTDASDPGLTDLIAAHREGDYGRFGRQTCECGWTGDSHPAHLALVVEQHTNGRIAELATKVRELEADITHRKVRNTLSRMGRDDDPETIAAWRETVMGWMDRAENAEIEVEDLKSTIARVITALEAAEKSVPDDWGVTYIYTSQLRAALEGEQQ